MQRPSDDTDPVIGRRDYAPADRPEVEVLVNDAWRPGDLRGWTQRRHSGWWGHVEYTMGPAQNYLDTFPADQVRPFELNDELRGVLAFSERTFPDDETRDAAIYAELEISPVRYQHQLNWLAQQGHARPPD